MARRQYSPIRMPTLGERAARAAGTYPELNAGWEIPFSIFVNGRKVSGDLLANMHLLPIGVPGSFLVYDGNYFKGVLKFTRKGWEMENAGDDLANALEEYVVLWYE